MAKVKARTGRYLHIIKVPLDRVGEILKRFNYTKVVEVSGGGKGG